MGKPKPVPDGYHSITPYLIIRGAARAIDFYKQAFGATECLRIPGRDPNQVGHAELRIGNSVVMLADEYPDMEVRGPESIGGTPVGLLLYVPDADAVFNQAVAAGAKVLKALENKFYGDRSGSVTDPFGHVWHIATHQEDISPEEMRRRAAEMCASSQ
jgi:PhnB protein